MWEKSRGHVGKDASEQRNFRQFKESERKRTGGNTKKSRPA